MAAKTKLPTNRLGAVPIQWIESRQRWQLTVYRDGKRTRATFATQEEAKKAWADHTALVARHGLRAADYDAAAHAEYEEAKRLASGADLREVARFWAERRIAGADHITVEEAVKQFQKHKEGLALSARHINGLVQYSAGLADHFAGRKIGSITDNDILTWLLGMQRHYSPRTIKNAKNSIDNFFNWCVRRKMLQESPAAGVAVSDLPVVPPKPISVLTVDQAAAMMAWLAEHRPHFVAWHAIQLFAGIRNAEAGRFRWDWIDLERRIITMPGWATEPDSGSMRRIVKTGDDWALHGLPDNLWAWLRWSKGEGNITRPNTDGVMRLRTKHFPSMHPPIPEWPHNAMRHTFCTMMISLYNDAAKVANWSRHTNTKQLYRSYVAKLVPKEEAERFFGIVPPA